MDIEQNLIEQFYKKLEIESRYFKYLSYEQMVNLKRKFSKDNKRVNYTNEINNPLEIVLDFYKEEYPLFYKIIVDGIINEKIKFDSEESYVDVLTKECHICYSFNDSDIFMIAHEFGHFIAINSNPKLIPDHSIFSEVLSIYMEKKLEKYLVNKGLYLKAVKSRSVNRIFFEKSMLDVVFLEYEYEQRYLSGKLVLIDLDIKNILKITRLGISNTINYLLRYPLGNIISNYLIERNIPIDSNLINILENLNIDELIDNYNLKEVYSCEEKRISRVFKKVR